MSSPFACNGKQSLFGKSKIDVQSKPEPVTLVADKSQVISAIIPFSTKMAGKIREHMHEYVRNDEGQKIFIFRQVNGWTNISLDATEDSPKLTADPIKTLIKAYTEFNKCSAVSKVDIKWTGSDEILGFDDIPMMESQFEPLPVKKDGVEVIDATKQSDAEVIFDRIMTLENKLDAIDNKLAHIIACVETHNNPNDPATSTADFTPERTVEKGKRRKQVA